MPEALRLVVQTPHAIVYDAPATSVRLPTSSGQIGLRARGEPLLSVVEPGLIVVHIGQQPSFIASAGGLLEVSRERALLLTPFAAKGDTDQGVLDALSRVLATPDSELSARKRLGELEQRVMHELREAPISGAAGATGARREEGP